MRYLDSHFSTDQLQEQLQVNYVTFSALIHNINDPMTKDTRHKFMLSRNRLSGIIYVGRIPTTEHDLLYTYVFHQPSYNLQMYEECILTTTRFPLVYYNDP